jgi:hypothetical protein
VKRPPIPGWTPLLAWSLLALGCAFDNGRDGELCDGQEDCPTGQVCFQHLCKPRQGPAGQPGVAPGVDAGDMPDALMSPGAPPPPDAGEDAPRLPPRPGVPGCPDELHCLVPLHDTYTDEAQPDVDLSDQGDLRADAETGTQKRIYLRFSLADYHPAINSVVGAQVSLRLLSFSGPDEARLRMLPAEADWPTPLTWERPPIVDSERPIGEIDPAVQPGGRVTVDVSDRVRRALFEKRDHVAFRLDALKASAPARWVFESVEADGASGAPWLELAPRAARCSAWR